MPGPDHDTRTALIDVFTALSAAAARAILQVAANGLVRIKADGSPVTDADEAAEAVIRYGLARLAPGFPVISEEQAERDRPTGVGESVILVDPLDGTRDFIAGRNEYTINMALVTAGAPVLGVITAPALGLIWRGIVGHGSERMELAADGKISPPRGIQTRRTPPRDVIVMASRSHLDPQTQAYLERQLPAAKIVRCGSAVKFCRLAEGAADHYPRLAPTCDWDVAAGHAILEAAGGGITTPDRGPLVYGTRELRIPGFLAWGDRHGASAIHS